MVKQYFSALFHGWVGKMSGPASVLLAFLPIVWPSLFGQSTILVRATWIAAAVCFMIANYSAWKYERDRYENELSKNCKPEIRGEARNFRKTGLHADGRSGNHIHATFGVTFELVLCNHRPVTTNLCNVSISGCLLSKLVMVSDLDFEPKTLDYGIAIAVPVTLLISLEGLTMADLKGQNVGLEEMRIGVFDGFGNWHPLPAPDETLDFYW